MLPPLLDPPLLSPARLIASLRLEAAGTGMCAGREVVLARGRPRRGPPPGIELSYQLQFDSEYGTLLRFETLEGQRPVQVTEALEVNFQANIEAMRFEFASPGDRRGREQNETGKEADTEPLQLAERADALRNVNVPPAAQALASNGTLWLTGLPAAGKTTLAAALKHELTRRGLTVCVLDGDDLRAGLSNDLGLSRGDRAEQARRAAHVAALVAQTGTVAIVALVSPYAQDRRAAREVHRAKSIPFFEIWVDTPLAVCEKRDPKGLYSNARNGGLTGVTGIDDPYEPPMKPDLRIAGDGQDPHTAASRIIVVLGIRDQARPDHLRAIDSRLV